MDPITHVLASFAVTRALFPLGSRMTVVAAVAAGTLADAEAISSFLGPSAYLSAHGTVTHSILGAVLLSAMVAGIFWAVSLRKEAPRISLPAAVAATFCAAALHLLMDLCQAEGISVFWPFRDTRYELDWLGGIDPWILAILLAGILLPALFGLVTEEIGARSNSPRGRGGAIFALLAVTAYTGGRAILHANAVAALTAHTYRGEIPRKAGAFPQSVSPLEWNGIVETESAMHQVSVPAGPGVSFDPDAAVTIYKPAPSPIFQTASGSPAARRFLRIARFPKATVEKSADGYRFELRDLRYAAAGASRNALAVVVELDANGKITGQEIVWEQDLRK